MLEIINNIEPFFDDLIILTKKILFQFPGCLFNRNVCTQRELCFDGKMITTLSKITINISSILV